MSIESIAFLALLVVLVTATVSGYYLAGEVERLRDQVESYKVKENSTRDFAVIGPDGETVGVSHNRAWAEGNAKRRNTIARHDDIHNRLKQIEADVRMARHGITYRWDVYETDVAYVWGWRAWVGDGPRNMMNDVVFVQPDHSPLWEKKGTATSSQRAREAVAAAIREHYLNGLVPTSNLNGYSGTVRGGR